MDKNTCHPLLAAAACMLLAGAANAQTTQTVEGAHRFLKTAPGISIRYVPPAGVAKFEGNPAVLSVWVRATDNVDQNGKNNPCVTRITELDYENTTVYSRGERWNSAADGVTILRPLADFPSPRYINWGKVSITRLTNSMKDGSDKRDLIVATSSGGDGYGLNVADPLVADRVEYAMRFLQASCDEAASTGF